MEAIVALIFLWCCLTATNRAFEKRKFNNLQQEVQDLRSILTRRQAGQSWEQIRKDDEELELIRRYRGIK